jgi:hypothetical protein
MERYDGLIEMIGTVRSAPALRNRQHAPRPDQRHDFEEDRLLRFFDHELRITWHIRRHAFHLWSGHLDHPLGSLAGSTSRRL